MDKDINTSISDILSTSEKYITGGMKNMDLRDKLMIISSLKTEAILEELKEIKAELKAFNKNTKQPIAKQRKVTKKYNQIYKDKDKIIVVKND